jgi:uncharacterized protein (TIGR02145 family)
MFLRSHSLFLLAALGAVGSTLPHATSFGQSQSGIQETSGSFTDSRDGQTYRWVRLGDQIWMAENLRFAAGTGCWAWNDDEGTVAERGRYYDWDAAMRSAPPGWHLPTDEEWKELERYLGLSREVADGEGARELSDRILAGRLKKVGRWHLEYEGHPVPVTDDTGFSALPIGWRAQNQFFHEGYTGWWSSSEVGDQAWIRGLQFFEDSITRILNSKRFGFSVRCVRDPLQ